MTQATVLERSEPLSDGRSIPCICHRQHEPNPPVGRQVGYAMVREQLVERVRCSSCSRTWKRLRA